MKVDRYEVTLPGEFHLLIANDGRLTVVTPRFVHLMGRPVHDLLKELDTLKAGWVVNRSVTGEEDE